MQLAGFLAFEGCFCGNRHGGATPEHIERLGLGNRLQHIGPVKTFGLLKLLGAAVQGPFSRRRLQPNRR